jgi:hypothetical protein
MRVSRVVCSVLASIALVGALSGCGESREQIELSNENSIKTQLILRRTDARKPKLNFTNLTPYDIIRGNIFIEEDRSFRVRGVADTTYCVKHPSRISDQPLGNAFSTATMSSFSTTVSTEVGRRVIRNRPFNDYHPTTRIDLQGAYDQAF